MHLEAVVLAVVAALCAAILQGCSGMEAGVFVRKHDTHTVQQNAIDKPLVCYFTNCKEGQ